MTYRLPLLKKGAKIYWNDAKMCVDLQGFRVAKIYANKRILEISEKTMRNILNNPEFVQPLLTRLSFIPRFEHLSYRVFSGIERI